MKPATELNEEESVPAPVGDAIGDTAYSQRFVLKILLKLANLDTLKEEIKEKSFEEDLCTLWDMTAERDVVLFLQKHDVLKLFNFALPVMDSSRIIEIVVGIIGNMCCQKEAVTALLNMEPFLTVLLEYIKTDDSLVLVQLLRLINSALYLSDDDTIPIWMRYFESLGYSKPLFYILKHSSNRILVITAIENLNTICTHLNTERTRADFFDHFVNDDAVLSVVAACIEIMVNKKHYCDKDQLERVAIICLQVMLILFGFDKSQFLIQFYNKTFISDMLYTILNYYEDKVIKKREMDPGLVDIIECTNSLVTTLKLSEVNSTVNYFSQSYCIWKAICLVKTQKNDESEFEDETNEEKTNFLKEIKIALGTLLSEYMLNCVEENLLSILDEMGNDCDDMIAPVVDEELKTNVTKRIDSYRNRLKETESS